MPQVTGLSQLMQTLRNEITETRRQAVAAEKSVARTLLTELMDKTPVWSGETVRNYAAGIGGKPDGAAHDASGIGDPGPTNSMSLGEEPRRPANESAARDNLESVLSGLNTLKPLVMTNLINDAKWEQVDSGAVPTPGTARYAGAIALRAEQATRVKHQDVLE